MEREILPSIREHPISRGQTVWTEYCVASKLRTAVFTQPGFKVVGLAAVIATAATMLL